MNRIAVFPGSFDPFTNGHHDIVLRASAIFDKVIIALGINTSKNHLFSTEVREAAIEAIFENNDTISVKSFSGMTIDFCKKEGANTIIRGVRNVTDFEYEKAILEMNKKMAPEIDTLILTTSPDFGAISSTIIREIIRSGGDASAFIPEKGLPVYLDRNKRV